MEKIFLKDIENMEEILLKTADRCDILQDRFVYCMAKAIRDILIWIAHKDK